jgi:hypothetical protein
MSNTLNTRPTPRSRKRRLALLTGLVGAALGATMAGPLPSASALIVSDQAGDPGGAYFADAGWRPTPVLQAKRVGNAVALSTGAMVVTPDPTAPEGPQRVDVTYYLYKRDAAGVLRLFRTATSRNIQLDYRGQNVPQAFAGSGTLATVTPGNAGSFSIRVAVSWTVDWEWQSVVHLRPDQAGELSCTNVSRCTVYAPGPGIPASLGIA